MNGDQVKAFIYLLCEAWLQEPRASLPDDDSELAAMARVSDSQWLSLKDGVHACFFKGMDGRLYNERLLEVSKLSEIRALNRNNKTLSKRKQKNIKVLTDRENEDEDSSLSLILSIYGAYPKRVGRGQAIRAIRGALKKIKGPELLEKVKAYALSVNGSDPKYIPHPATWFNGERWLDEAAPKTIAVVNKEWPKGKPSFVSGL